MTEEEAKNKWCPFARYVSSRGQSINRWVSENDQQLNPDPARCIGSACMAWRYEPRPWVGHGYCGLVNTPENLRLKQP